MVFVQTIVHVSDNSGALLGGCLQSRLLPATVGHIIVISVKKNIFKKHVVKKSRIIVKKQICRCVLIRTCKSIKRWGSFFIRAGFNAVVLLNMYELPYATRLLGFLFREMRMKIRFRKLVSMTRQIY